jgi:protease-4
MAADKIYAEPGTLTGSIGVVGGKVALKGLFEKVGLTTEVISRGQNSGWASMDEPFTDSERKVVTQLMQDIYKQFTEKAADCRKMKLEELESLAGGRVYSGQMALDNKLVDELGTLEDAVAEVKRMAGMKKEDKVERMSLPEPKSVLEELFGGSLLMKSGVSSLAPELVGQFKQAESLRRLFAEPAVLVMPHPVKIR